MCIKGHYQVSGETTHTREKIFSSHVSDTQKTKVTSKTQQGKKQMDKELE